MAELLLVDDDNDVVETLLEILEGKGHQVRTAADGAQGLMRIQERFPELVLLDVDMPVLSGPGMAYRMFIQNAGREKLPIILLSGAPDLRLIAAEVGTPYYLAKPYRLVTFLALLERALRERTPPAPQTPS